MSIPLIYREDVVETFMLKRAERMWTSRDDIFSHDCHLSKNVWNQSQYIVEEEYKKSGDIPPYSYVWAKLSDKSYYKDNPDFDNYHKLPPATSQQIIKYHSRSWTSFKEAKEGYFDPDNPKRDSYTGEPKEPKHKKKDGEFILVFTNQQCKVRNGYLIFPRRYKGFKIKVRFDDSYTQEGFDLFGNGNYDLYDKKGNLKRNTKLQEVRVVPAGTGYWIEIVYDKEITRYSNYNSKYELNENIIIAIDLGVENLGTITDNIGSQPIIIKCPEIKCANQWYNKNKAELSSIYDRNMVGKACLLKVNKKTKKVEKSLDKYGRIKYIIQKTGPKLDIITDNRNKKVMDILHKFSRGIINHVLKVKAKTIAIGKNPGWKQKIKMGKKNNQNFVNIPFAKLIKLVRYKAEEYGMEVLDPTEGYTSKCSFLDSEDICHQDNYIGRRTSRGMFRSSKGLLIKKGNKTILINEINADVQGSYNILRKVDPKFTVYSVIEGVAAHGLVPIRLSVSDLLTEVC
jgi:putative transposase